MPTEAALVTAVSLIDRWPDEQFDLILYWFLQASRFGRYSGSGTTSLEEDLRDVGEASTMVQAIERLLARFDHERPLTSEDFLRDYVDARFGRFLLYLMAYANQARDWDEAGHRIGFQGKELLRDFRPQWHHVFPRKFLEGKVPDDRVDVLANIAVIGPTINIRISAKDPMDYIERYSITPAKLEEQHINPDIRQMSVERYDEWVSDRAVMLADAGNAFLSNLRV